MPGSYIVEDDIIKCFNKKTGKVEPISDDNQPPPHPTNIKQGTADEFYWKVYGLGLRGAMTGVIFANVEYITEWPEDIAWTYGLDFGFTNDPTALTRFDEDDHNIWIELLLYEPIDHPDDLDAAFKHLKIEKDIAFDNLKGLGVMSGIALKLMFLDAIIKAKMNEGDNRTSIERCLNIIASGIKKTVNTKLNNEELLVSVQFNSILPSDLKEAVEIAVNAVQGGVMSRETAVDYLDMVEDKDKEIERVKLDNNS